MTKAAKTTTNNDEDTLDDLSEDMDEGELDDIDPVVTPFTVPVMNGDAAISKRLANYESEKNIGLQIQPDG